MWKCENDLHSQNLFYLFLNAGLNLIFTFSPLHIYTFLFRYLTSALTLNDHLITSFTFCSGLQPS